LPFDPSKVKIESPIEKFKRTGKVKRGKLGMFIVHSFMDEVKYESNKSGNVVILTKFLRKNEG
jgi:anti-sigma regulatory factor (Ser/Thr protein kinase)